MKNEFFPYNYVDGGLSLKVLSAEADGKDSISLLLEEKTIDLTNLQGWNQLDLKVQVLINSGVVAKVFPKYEQSTKPWHVVLVATFFNVGGRQVMWRQSKVLNILKSNEYLWEGNYSLNYNDVNGSVVLHAFLTRSQNSDKFVDGFADELGLRLSISDQWVVQVNSKDSSSGKSMAIKWVDFGKSTDDVLRSVQDTLYYLDLTHDLPILYLNEGIPNLKTILSSQGHIGNQAAMRDALFRSIAQPVWIALISMAVSDEYEDENRPEWQENVLREISPYLFDDIDEDMATKKLVEVAQKKDKSILFQCLLPAIQKYIDYRKSTVRLIDILKPR